MSHKKAWK